MRVVKHFNFTDDSIAKNLHDVMQGSPDDEFQE